jgi:hypothetical protein
MPCSAHPAHSDAASRALIILGSSAFVRQCRSLLYPGIPREYPRFPGLQSASFVGHLAYFGLSPLPCQVCGVPFKPAGIVERERRSNSACVLELNWRVKDKQNAPHIR